MGDMNHYKTASQTLLCLWLRVQGKSLLSFKEHRCLVYAWEDGVRRYMTLGRPACTVDAVSIPRSPNLAFMDVWAKRVRQSAGHRWGSCRSM